MELAVRLEAITIGLPNKDLVDVMFGQVRRARPCYVLFW